MQAAFDLFGDNVETKEISKPKAPAMPKPRATATLDRRKIWGEGGYLATLDDDTSINTTESFTENATIERLEQALFMSPVIRSGLWVEDGSFYAYRILMPVMGPRMFGEKGSLLHDCTEMMLKASALKVLDESFDDTGSWLPRWAYWLFCYRLRKAGPTEDPYELLKAFTAVMTQFDYLDASRSGDTLRRLTKRYEMQTKRAEAREAGADLDDDADDADDDTFDEPELKNA